MSAFTAAIVVGAGTGINAVRQVQRNKEPFGTILAGLVFAAICVAINDASKSNLGTALAMVFLLSSILTNGVKFLDTLNKVVESY